MSIREEMDDARRRLGLSTEQFGDVEDGQAPSRRARRYRPADREMKCVATVTS
jgi:hypothetical protein